MGIPCKVFLKNDSKHKELFFFENDTINSFNACEIPELKELTELSISSETESLIKVEGFDLINGVDTDEEGWWKINKEQTYLYSFEHKMTEALIPGYYQVLLKSENNTIYFSWFKVNPKNMSVSEWEMMKEEIEKEVVGLSLDLKYRNTGKKHSKDPAMLKNLLFNKVTILSEELPKFTNMLNQVIVNPKSEIGKNYSWQDQGKKVDIDQQTIKYLSKFPERKKLVYSGKKFVNYNINVNRELLSIISRIELLLVRMKTTLDNYCEGTKKVEGKSKQLNFIYESLKIIDKYNLVIRELYAQPWIKSIPKTNTGPQHFNGIRDVRYGYIYKFYLKVNSNKPTKQLNSNYQLYWKRSDVLYEIWGYLKIITMIKESGYVPISGWIFDDSNFEIPFIKEGTIVVFEKDNVRLNVIYNEIIPEYNDGKDLYNPLYIKARNNKPDIRIDIFKDDSYYSSIVMDTKYRNFRNLWTLSEDVRNQLRNYKDSIKSKILYKNSPLESLVANFPLSPILEVWVLFPKSGNLKREEEIHLDEKISFKELSPTKDLNSVKKELIDLIDNTINIDKWNNL